MILLNKANTDDKIVVTLQELSTVQSPTYTFYFTHITTNREVQFSSEDLSQHKARYNEFEINTNAVFANYDKGQYVYKVIENESGKIVERGKMLLQDSTLVKQGYEPTITKQGYGG